MNSSWWVPGSSLCCGGGGDLEAGRAPCSPLQPPAAQSPGRKTEASEGMQGCGESPGGQRGKGRRASGRPWSPTSVVQEPAVPPKVPGATQDLSQQRGPLLLAEA